MMNERLLKVMLHENAVKKFRVVANSSAFHIEIYTQSQSKSIVQTTQGSIKCWRSLDACAKWIHKVGIGLAVIDIALWLPRQKALDLV